MILCIGNPVYDMIQTPFIKTPERILSGCSINAAITLAYQGSRAMVVGNLGADYGEHCCQTLEKQAIDYLLNIEGATGGFNLVYQTITQRTLEIWQTANPITQFPELDEPCEMILLGPILGEISLEWVEEIKTRFPRVPIALDPQGFLRRGEGKATIHYRPDTIERLFSLCDIIKPNELEAEIITGIDPKREPARAMEALKAMAPETATVIITLSDCGAIASENSHDWYIQAYPANAIDSTGVGDSFIGSLLHARRCGLPFHQQLCRATAASSFVIEQVGPWFEFPPTSFEVRCLWLESKLQEKIPHELIKV